MRASAQRLITPAGAPTAREGGAEQLRPPTEVEPTVSVGQDVAATGDDLVAPVSGLSVKMLPDPVDP